MLNSEGGSFLLVNNDFNNFDMLNIYPNLIYQLEVKNHFIKKGSNNESAYKFSCFNYYINND